MIYIYLINTQKKFTFVCISVAIIYTHYVLEYISINKIIIIGYVKSLLLYERIG